MTKIKDTLLLGLVTRGDGRGRQLGFPTANLDPSQCILINDDFFFSLMGSLKKAPSPTSGSEAEKLVKNSAERILFKEDLVAREHLSSDELFLFIHNLLRTIFAPYDSPGSAKTKRDVELPTKDILDYFNYHNLNRANKASPGLQELPGISDGVYAARAGGVSDQVLPAAVSLGTREQFYTKGKRIIEAHLIDTELDLYDKIICLNVEYFIRDQRKFSDTAELTAAIKKDVEESKRLFLMRDS